MPSVKLNEFGVKMKSEVKLGASGVDTVKDPEMLHSGGHVVLNNWLKGLPV